MAQRGEGLAPHLAQFVKEVQAMIDDAEKKLGPDGIPPLGLRDFIFYPANPTITATKLPDLRPERFLRTPLIVWHPTLFWRRFAPKIPCPSCKSTEHVVSNGWGEVRRCFDLNQSALFVGKKYYCKSCTGEISAHLLKFQAGLDLRLRCLAALRARDSARDGMSRALPSRMCSALPPRISCVYMRPPPYTTRQVSAHVLLTT
jgi:hypothetical protein